MNLRSDTEVLFEPKWSKVWSPSVDSVNGCVKKGKDGLTAADRKKHQKIGKKVKKELEQVPQQDFKDFKTFHTNRKQKAKKLESQYGPKVRKKVKGKTVKLKVKFNPVAKDEKDGDVDFKVVIAPNATVVPGAAVGGAETYPNGMRISKRKLSQLWDDAHPTNQTLNGESSQKDKDIRAKMARKVLLRRYGKRVQIKRKLRRPC